MTNWLTDYHYHQHYTTIIIECSLVDEGEEEITKTTTVVD